MIKILMILFACLLGVCTATFGQEKFLDAYVVTNERDTIQGQILSKTDSELAFEISFKKDASDSKATSYLVSNLVGFRFTNGRTFERISFPKTEFDSTSVFAKKVITGKFDLWIWRNSNDEPDIFIKNNSNQKFVHLTKVKDKSVAKEGKEYIQYNYKYIGQLKYVTDDEFRPPSRTKNLKYSDNNIVDQILSINQKHEAQIPTHVYEEEIKFRYDISAGIPFRPDSKSTEFRLGLFRRKIRSEKTASISTIRGITYYGWYEHGGYKGSIGNGESNYIWQLINILPVGLHVQGKHKTIKPYGYIGFGLGVIVASDYQIVDSENKGSKTSFHPFPAVYSAVGLKVRIRSNYLFAEYTPSTWNSTISLGFEF